MIAVLVGKFTLLRIAAILVLSLLIGAKVVSPVYSFIKAKVKFQVSKTQYSDKSEEKESSDSNTLEKEGEFASICDNHFSHKIWFTIVTHITVYQNNYQATYYLKLNSPPPDFYLPLTV